MKNMSGLRLLTCILGALVLCPRASLAQAVPPADHPAVTVKGQTYTPRSILARNMGTEADRITAFPPHRIVGNIYYVGTNTLSSFLIATAQGHILIDSTYERNVPTIEKSVTQLGFRFSDIKVLLGNHAHGDHQEGDALVKQMTGAQVMAMAEDVPALQAMKPGGKEHPIDKVLHDGEAVMLGGTTLVAHLTPGHTPGCTTWTTTAEEGGKTYNVMFGCSLRPPAVLTPALVDQFNPRSKPCAHCPATCNSAITVPNTTCRRNTPSSKMVIPIPSSTPPPARWRRTSRRRCSTRSWPSSRPLGHRAGSNRYRETPVHHRL